jgi:uncharacterized peroxidase-related enzyme
MMNIFQPIESQTATTEAKAALDIVQTAFGGTPNLMKMLAAAPQLLTSVMAMNQAVNSGDLKTTLVEQIALLTSGINHCEYCVAVHVYVGQQNGLSRSELLANLKGESSDPKVQAVLNFTKAVVHHRGQVDPAPLQELRDQGFSNKAILEILGVIGLYTFLNYAKHLTQPVLDFPAVEEFQAVTGI